MYLFSGKVRDDEGVIAGTRGRVRSQNSNRDLVEVRFRFALNLSNVTSF